MINMVSSIWHASDGWPIRNVRLGGHGGIRGSLLFLAGRGDHIEKYAETLRHWAQQGWAVESFDWRGQGGSGRFVIDPTLGHVEDFTCWFDDLAAYCADWQTRTQRPHMIVAHSMGGHIALHGLTEGRVRVDAAVLVAPMLGLWAGGLPHALAAGIVGAACFLGYAERSLWRPRRRTQKLMDMTSNLLTHSVERYEREARLRRERPELVMDAPTWGWLRAAYRAIDRLSEPGHLERVTTPLLILATKGDRMVSARAIARTAQRLPHARLHFYGRHVAHEILREVDSVRDDALARIDAFFNDHASAVGTGKTDR